MRVNFNSTTMIKFGDIPIGTTFVFQNDVYIKTKPCYTELNDSSSQFNCFCLTKAVFYTYLSPDIYVLLTEFILQEAPSNESTVQETIPM